MVCVLSYIEVYLFGLVELLLKGVVSGVCIMFMFERVV